MMKLQSDFLDQVEIFSNRLLKRKDDLKIIVEAFNKSDQPNNVEDFFFTGKYINGLFRVLKNSGNIPKVENVDQIKKDLSENIEKLISQLKRITLRMNDEEKKQIEFSYFELTQNTLHSLQELAEDLDSAKKYLNYLKRIQPK